MRKSTQEKVSRNKLRLLKLKNEFKKNLENSKQNKRNFADLSRIEIKTDLSEKFIYS